jgi:hypothetical protein
VIQTTKLASRRYLAEEAFGFLRLRGFHRLTPRHLRGHCTTLVGAPAHLHRTFSSQAAGRQPTDGQHSAKQQEEQGPEKFHGWNYSEAILFMFQEFVARGARRTQPLERTIDSA